MTEFHRHRIAPIELEKRKLLFSARETAAVERLFAPFLEKGFALLVNGASRGRAEFGRFNGRLYLACDPDCFKGMEAGSAAELTAVDITTLALTVAPPIERCIADLASSDEATVVGAVRALGAARPLEAIDPLFAALAHPLPAVRNAAVRALSRYEPRPEIGERLVAMLADRDENVRSRACDALAHQPGGEAEEALARAAAGDRSLTVRWAARLALRERRAPGYDTAELDL